LPTCALRESLREEEQRVSYWRQLVQGRLDLVRTALDGGHPSVDDLAGVAAARARTRRALHERIDDCTAQLVGHDQRDPAQLAEIVPR
jgi:hypothetical protein